MVVSTVSREEREEGDGKRRPASKLSRESLAQRCIYDTKGFGRGKMGHAFGDQLTEDERLAIIEFLKSLSGPNMPSVSAPKIPDRLVQLGID